MVRKPHVLGTPAAGVRALLAFLFLAPTAGCDTELDPVLGRRGQEPGVRLLDGGPGGEVGGEGPGRSPGTKPRGGATDMCGDVRATQYVYNGTLEPSFLSLSKEQVLAIGLIDMGGSLCSGTLIAPKWVLTAAHCSFSSATFNMGAEPSSPNISVRARRFIAHRSADIALIELEEDATGAAPDVVPIRVTLDAVDRSWVGRDTEASGYGRTTSGSVGTRYFSSLPIDDVDSESIHINGQGQGGVCNGDSGGPIMARADDGTVRLIGVVSGGDGSCTYAANFTRADAVRPWIEEHTGPIPEDDGLGCGDITREGRCMDGAAVYCNEAEELVREPCEGGSSCGFDASVNGYRCVAAASDPCQGVDSHGQCDGNVAKWCDNGQLRNRDCTACGQVCGEVAEAGGIYCNDDPCQGVDYLGRCDGDVAFWCDDGQLKNKDCAQSGQRCGWIDDQLGNFCQ